MSGYYPEGVTGSEYQIAGADTEEALPEGLPCPFIGRIDPAHTLVLMSYAGEYWVACDECDGEVFDLPSGYPWIEEAGVVESEIDLEAWFVSHLRFLRQHGWFNSPDWPKILQDPL